MSYSCSLAEPEGLATISLLNIFWLFMNILVQNAGYVSILNRSRLTFVLYSVHHCLHFISSSLNSLSIFP